MKSDPVDPVAIKALDRAKLDLMMLKDTVFYTTILFSLKQVWSDSHNTAAIDGKCLYINQHFFMSLNKNERVGLLIHEILHVALHHMIRKDDRDPDVWNQAADYVINNMLYFKYTLPKGALLNNDYTNMDTEQVYSILIKNKPPTMDNPDIIYPKSNDLMDVKEDVTRIVLRAVEQTKNTSYAGNVPDEVIRNLDSIINPKLPWNVILQNYMSEYAKEDFSFTRPNRRFMPDMYMPSLYSNNLTNLLVAIDTSGSISKKEFSHFVSEIKNIQETLKPEILTIIDFDVIIHNVHNVTTYTDILDSLNFNGGGGTHIEPVLQYINENTPTITLVFTDGDFNIPDKDLWPKLPIIWIVHNYMDLKIPFGTTINYEL